MKGFIKLSISSRVIMIKYGPGLLIRLINLYILVFGHEINFRLWNAFLLININFVSQHSSLTLLRYCSLWKREENLRVIFSIVNMCDVKYRKRVDGWFDKYQHWYVTTKVCQISQYFSISSGKLQVSHIQRCKSCSNGQILWDHLENRLWDGTHGNFSSTG